jgi:hypothetical protein
MNLNPIANLLKTDAILFWSNFGSKAVAESWTQRLNKQIKSVEQIKDYTNINIATGRESGVVDTDLDCEEANKLADYFLPQTELEFGRESTPRAHRLYKVIDLTIKHTRNYCSFADPKKSMLVEIRANKHYTMCWGQYENQEKVVWSKSGLPTEISWEALNKAVALLGVASVILRKYAKEGLRNEYIRKMVATLWQHKLEKSDAEKIIKAVTTVAGDDTEERLARVADVYKRDRTEQLLGLPALAAEFNWKEDEVKDFKKLLFKITGRDVTPEFTHEFVNRIAYMMKQKKYYDLEDKEMYDAEAIDVKYAKKFPNYTPLKWWKMHPDSKVCVDFTYKPADQSRFVNVSKKLMINVFEKNDLQPDSKVDTDVYYDLLKTVIPHDAERNHFLNWKAYQYQNPGKKIRHALILQSDEFQLGKGSLFDVHRDILGTNNTRKIELEEALDKGKGYLINAITVLIDEAKSSGSWSEKAKLINTLKTIISEGSIGVRQLYKEYAEQDTCTNYWINTNYRDAFPLPYNEVRYWVYFSPGKRNDGLLDRYHLHREQHNLAAGVYADLLDRDLSKFKPLGVAPHTIYRDQMSKLADRPLNDFVKEQFEQGVFPFDRDMVTTVELFDFLKVEKRMRVTREREIANALELIGSRKKPGCPVDQVGKSVTIWTIRDYDKYKNHTAKELGRVYVPFFSDARNK